MGTKRKSLWIGLVLLIASCVLSQAFAEQSAQVFQHELKVSVQPEKSLLRVEDRLNQSGGDRRLSFALADYFQVSVNGQMLKPVRSRSGLAHYKIALDSPNEAVTLSYEGKIESTDQCDWLRQSCRLLNQRGAYLDTGSFWYPVSPGVMHTFSLTFEGPESWESLSQGEQIGKHQWRETQPQDDIYLLAGPFKVYESEAEGRKAMVYLQQENQHLAGTYLQTTHHYLDQYSKLIGEYPYKKFATVESFWETGWGMPSFTLLGPQVIRLPFIPHTSLPHEILHNWWGNSVYIDFQSGNWAEGLTAYMADHHSRELRGSDKGYRRDALQKYALFAQGEKDFPLAEFRSRHNNTTQAVGYSKALMFFHQLRRQLGDEVFYAGLKHFFEANRFQTASYDDLKTSFEQASGQKLGAYFQQWTQREGAPALVLESVEQTGKRLKLTLSQSSQGKPFHLQVPVDVTLSSGSKIRHTIAMTKSRQNFSLEANERVSKVDVDPDFDLVRFPDPAELPVTLNSRYGKGEVSIRASGAGDAAIRPSLDRLAKGLQRGGTQAELTDNSSPLPTSGAVIVVNPDSQTLVKLTELIQAFPIDDTQLAFAGKHFDRSVHSSAMALKGNQLTVVVLDAPDASSLATLVRKMRHYGKYSYIAFDAKTGRNVLKGQWIVENTPLTRRLEQ